MKKTLVLLAHPDLPKSRLNKALLAEIQGAPGITVHDLYARYPDLKVDITHEQRLLSEHDVIVFQFPLYWYSTPALLKQWQDDVLTWGFAFGAQGLALQGKKLFCAITTGSPAVDFQPGARSGFTLEEFLRPIQQTALFCKLEYVPDPFVVQGSRKITDAELKEYARNYRKRLLELQGTS